MRMKRKLEIINSIVLTAVTLVILGVYLWLVVQPDRSAPVALVALAFLTGLGVIQQAYTAEDIEEMATVLSKFRK